MGGKTAVMYGKGEVDVVSTRVSMELCVYECENGRLYFYRDAYFPYILQSPTDDDFSRQILSLPIYHLQYVFIHCSSSSHVTTLLLLLHRSGWLV